MERFKELLVEISNVETRQDVRVMQYKIIDAEEKGEIVFRDSRILEDILYKIKLEG